MAKVLCSGSWQPPTQEGANTMVHMWSVGQIVNVQARTWAGINRQGGHGKITKLHYSEDGQIVSIDVKYTLSSCFDRNLEPYLVSPWQELERTERRRAPQKQERGHTQQQKQNKPLQQNKKNKVPTKKQCEAREEDADEKENNNTDKHDKAVVPAGAPPSKPQRRRSPAVPRSFSLKKSKATTRGKSQEKAATTKGESSNNNKNVTLFSVPSTICVDDDDALSIVSELEVGMGVEETRRNKMIVLRPDGETDTKKPPQRRPTLETSTSHSHSSHNTGRASPCSKAQSMASGQLVAQQEAVAVTTTKTNEQEQQEDGPFISATRMGNSKQSLNSPSTPITTTKSLAVGQIQPQIVLHKNDDDIDEMQEDKAFHHLQEDQRQPSSNYVTLQQVYISEKQRATEFLNQVVDHRDDDNDEVMLDTQAQNTTDFHDDDDDLEEDAMSCTSNCSRRNFFVLRLVDLLQENDGVLDEDDALLAMINQTGQHNNADPLDWSNVQEYLQFLCDENKIMRSDGQIYSI